MNDIQQSALADAISWIQNSRGILNEALSWQVGDCSGRCGSGVGTRGAGDGWREG
jgi:hypothetical protein